MKHLDLSSAVTLAEGGDDSCWKFHLLACESCRKLVDSMRRTIAALTQAGEPLEEPPRGLLRWARAYAHMASAAKPRMRVLEFLAGGAHPLAAVRSGLEHAQAILYGDQETQVDLRVAADAMGHIRLHGQVVPMDVGERRTWTLRVISPNGEVHSATSDEDGEFWIDGLSSSYGWTLLAETDDLRVLVPRFGVEDDGRDDP